MITRLENSDYSNAIVSIDWLIDQLFPIVVRSTEHIGMDYTHEDITRVLAHGLMLRKVYIERLYRAIFDQGVTVPKDEDPTLYIPSIEQRND